MVLTKNYTKLLSDQTCCTYTRWNMHFLNTQLCLKVALICSVLVNEERLKLSLISEAVTWLWHGSSASGVLSYSHQLFLERSFDLPMNLLERKKEGKLRKKQDFSQHVDCKTSCKRQLFRRMDEWMDGVVGRSKLFGIQFLHKQAEPKKQYFNHCSCPD